MNYRDGMKAELDRLQYLAEKYDAEGVPADDPRRVFLEEEIAHFAELFDKIDPQPVVATEEGEPVPDEYATGAGWSGKGVPLHDSDSDMIYRLLYG